jgi:hypothetical protein
MHETAELHSPATKTYEIWRGAVKQHGEQTDRRQSRDDAREQRRALDAQLPPPHDEAAEESAARGPRNNDDAREDGCLAGGDVVLQLQSQ